MSSPQLNPARKLASELDGTRPSVGSPWSPSWRWHARALLGIFLFLAVFYFVVDRMLSRLPEPYRLRVPPQEVTPWLKKK